MLMSTSHRMYSYIVMFVGGGAQQVTGAGIYFINLVCGKHKLCMPQMLGGHQLTNIHKTNIW